MNDEKENTVIIKNPSWIDLYKEKMDLQLENIHLRNLIQEAIPLVAFTREKQGWPRESGSAKKWLISVNELQQKKK